MPDKATKPTILAIETATSSCSAALSKDGMVLEQAEVGSNVHSKVLLEMVNALFDEFAISVADLHAVAVGQGPGSFTGLRIGVGVGQGIAYGANCPMIGVSSLDALGMQSDKNGRIIAGIDARMGEIYWCEYEKHQDQLTRISSLQVTPPNEVSCSENVYLVGNAWSEYQDSLSDDLKARSEQLQNVVYPSAQALLTVAETRYANGDRISAAEFAPIYVRDNVAKKPNS